MSISYVIYIITKIITSCYTRLILGLCPANERRHYFVMTSLIGWAQAYNQPCFISHIAKKLLSQCHYLHGAYLCIINHNSHHYILLHIISKNLVITVPLPLRNNQTYSNPLAPSAKIISAAADIYVFGVTYPRFKGRSPSYKLYQSYPEMC